MIEKDRINILDYRWNKYTDRGNDGIIDFITKALGIKKGIFVEFGAWDGEKNCNSRLLFEKGWNGLFLECDKIKYKALKRNYKKYKNIICLNKKIGKDAFNLFDNIVDPYLKGKEIDFCSIDIDGLDLEVFETFEKYLPKIVCIEGGQMLHPFCNRIEENKAEKNVQQSLKVMNESFEKKGYKLLCSYQDSFFVKKEYYYLFNISNDILDLYLYGLKCSIHRFPFIQKCLKKVKLKNNIIDFILEKTFYYKYGWDNRQKWCIDNKNEIHLLIDTIRCSKDIVGNYL
jgi:hypothetical protein